MYRVPGGVRSTRNDDGGVLLDLERGKLLRLNSTGALIFEWLREGQSESQIATRISEDWGVSRETVENDLVKFLGLLKQQHLLL
ncbi:MAG: PqqD family protein [Terriglobia bacterium]|nr:PqqD family protein [Terriglobia bacterium]